MRYVIAVTFGLLFTTSGTALATCYAEAAGQYGVPEELLRATAAVESSGNRKAVGRNPDGTSDLGLMQINSSHLAKLKQWGITRHTLLNDGCMNVKVGAWLMADNFRRHGYTWNGVGAYNVGCRGLSKKECQIRRNRYAVKIYKALARNAEPGTPFIAVAVQEGASHVPGIATVSFAAKGDS